MKLSLNQAAKECGRAKSTILDAIKNGRMSAPKNDRGRYEIDPAELFRVFGPTEQAKPEATSEKTAPDSILQERLSFKEELVDRLEKEIEELKAQRDQWQKQAERQMLLIEKSEGSQKSGFWSIFRK